MELPMMLPPFPRGWYALGLSSELPPGAVRPLQFMGQDVVLFRTAAGEAAVFDAYCPHLGAHMGHGGRVEGESLRCPFHGFCFDTRGECTFIPYGTRPPPRAKAGVWPSVERHGLILAYYDPEGAAPAWDIPPLSTAGWSPLLARAMTLRGHPQETTENSVDLGHFATVHGYTRPETIKPLLTDGAYLSTAYAAVRPATLGRAVRTEFQIHVHGLGYSLVEACVPEYDLLSRMFVLATPLDGSRITLRVAVSVYGGTRPAAIHPLLAAVPKPLVIRLLRRLAFEGLVHDVSQDFVIWEHKRYVQPPILAEGDGPVGKYRLWARQFYRPAEAELV